MTYLQRIEELLDKPRYIKNFFKKDVMMEYNLSQVIDGFGLSTAFSYTLNHFSTSINQYIHQVNYVSVSYWGHNEGIIEIPLFLFTLIWTNKKMYNLLKYYKMSPSLKEKQKLKQLLDSDEKHI